MSLTAQSVYDLFSDLEVQMGDVSEFFALFAYQGFNPEMIHAHFANIAKTKNIPQSELIGDLRALVSLGALKGNYTLRNAGKISEDGKKTADSLYEKYEMKVGSVGSDRLAVTLPRVLSAFPEITMKICMYAPAKDFGPGSNAFSRCVKNPVFPAFVPQKLEQKLADALLAMYNLYGAEQSVKISTAKDLAAAYEAQMHFTRISFNSVFPGEPVRTRFMKAYIKEVVASYESLKKEDVKKYDIPVIDTDVLKKAVKDLE